MNGFCANCYGQATKFCVCQNTASLFCEDCLRKHEVNLPYEMHDSSPLAYYMVLQDLGVEGFRVRKQQISTGAAVVRKLEEEERKQYDQAKDDLAQTYALYMQWLDYVHNTFAQLIQRFHQEKLIPLTNSQPQLSPFSFFVYSAGEIAVNDIGVVEKEPGRKFKA